MATASTTPNFFKVGSGGAYQAGTTGGVTDTVQVTDSKGAVASTTVTVTPAVAITNAPPLSTYPGGSIAFGATGGAGGYAWSMIANPSGGSIVKGTGAYTAGANGSTVDTVEVTDANGATAQASVSVGPAMKVQITGPTPVPPNGTVGLLASGGDGGPYNWAVTTKSSGAPSVTSPGTTATYTAGATGNVTDVVTANDSHGNSATVQIPVGAALAISPTSPSVAPRQSVTFGATGGSGKYTFSMTSPPSGGSITPAGAYTAGTTPNVVDTVVVKDSLGNTASTGVNVGPGVSIGTPGGTSTPPQGSLQLTVKGGYAGGTPPYAWTLAPNASGGSITQGGLYKAGPKGSVQDTVTVADSLGNSASVVVTVTAGVSIAPPSASLPPLGTQSFAASGGSGSGFKWSMAQAPSGGTVSATGGYKAGAKGPATDVVQVTDSLGNVATATVTVGPSISISAASTTTPPLGSLTFGASGGNGKYSWQVTTNNSVGATVTPNGSSVTYTAGATGKVSDTVTVTDTLGNTASVNVSVGGGVAINPSSPPVPPRGSVTFSATGGSGTGFAFTLTTNASGGAITAAGVYTAGAAPNVSDTVTATDSLGNTASTVVHVGPGVGLSPIAASMAPLGSLTFAANGGSGTGFVYSLATNASGGSIDPASGMYAAGPTGNVTDTVQVTDSLGNGATAKVTIGPALALAPTKAATPPRGSASFTASGGAGTYVFSVLNNASGASVGPSGAYVAGSVPGVEDTVQVTDANGATATATVAVGPGVSISPATPSVAPSGTIPFVAAGGSGTGYTWQLTTDLSGGSITAAGVYTAGSKGKTADTVQVTDSLGNTASVSISVGGGLALAPTDPYTPPLGKIAFTATGGAGGFTWSLPTNASGGTIDAKSGAYVAGPKGSVTDVVQVSDSSGTTASTHVTVGPEIQVTPSTTTVATGGTVAFGVSGGSGSGYAWTLGTNASGGTIDAKTGAYVAGGKGGVDDTVKVVDSLGNAGSASVTVTAKPGGGGDGGADSGVDGGASDASGGSSGGGGGNDASVSPDAASSRDGGGGPGASAGADAGPGAGGAGACGCTTAGEDGGAGAGALSAIALGLALVARRRRKDA